jgi:hypothetical protein
MVAHIIEKSASGAYATVLIMVFLNGSKQVTIKRQVVKNATTQVNILSNLMSFI